MLRVRTPQHTTTACNAHHVVIREAAVANGDLLDGFVHRQHLLEGNQCGRHRLRVQVLHLSRRAAMNDPERSIGDGAP